MNIPNFTDILTKIKTIKREYIIAATAIMFALLFLKQCNDSKFSKEKYKDLQNTVLLKDQKINRYRDDSGKTHATILATEASRQSIEIVYKKELADAANQLHIKEKKITDYVRIISEAKGNGNGKLTKKDSIVYVYGKDSTILKRDTVTLDQMNINDKYLTFNSVIYKDFTYKYNYIYADSLYLIKHIKNSGFLGLKKTKIFDVHYSNPNASVTGITQFTIKDLEKEKKYSFGISLSYGWNGKSFQPQVGIGVQYILFKF